MVTRKYRRPGKPIYRHKTKRSSYVVRRDTGMMMDAVSRVMSASMSDAISYMFDRFGKQVIDEFKAQKVKRNPATGRLEAPEAELAEAASDR